jgi:hypothetical protein
MNIDVNTARLAKEVFRGLDYTPINLAEHHINIWDWLLINTKEATILQYLIVNEQKKGK